MPYVMLKRTWPASFRRTITTETGTKTTLEFAPGVPVELSAFKVNALRADIGVALQPVEFDDKTRPRVITDEVIAESVEEPNEPATTDEGTRRNRISQRGSLRRRDSVTS